MISRTRPPFWERFGSLPEHLQQLAREKFALWRREPFHASLQFKQLRPGLWSVRINDQYRALAGRKGDIVVWFWIGTHAEYNHLIK